jgi:lipid-A-disaccharide synthase
MPPVDGSSVLASGLSPQAPSPSALAVPMNPTMHMAMVAGEASGDLLASLLLGGLHRRWPALQATGIGGPKMVAAGFEAWWPSDRLAVHGYVEALRHYREISAIRESLARRLLTAKPRVFVGVDAPDFNLGLEKRLKAAGVRTVHFVCPSIWAWRSGRARKMAESADHVLCLFPFEPELLHAHGVAATFVGHPLADAIPLQPPRAASRAALGLSDGDRVVALLPGSRRAEISGIAPAFLQAAALMHRRRPGLRYLLPVAPGLRGQVDPLVAEHAPGLPLQVLDGQSHAVLAACDVTMIASGTATLEAALFKRPMVIGYRMNGLSWQIMSRMRLQPWVGLPNILSREFVVPELLQGDCTPEALARATMEQLDDSVGAARLYRRFDEIHQGLRRDTARSATDAIAQIVQA